ncbi:HEXXH motif domain-containing protein [Streptomyces sp. TUS-ST3]|jgi:hypothetical protein|uniref:aKG-HExxH-type peptide beta-hydroxylase n=1 Tax=Streptomyces sp. TUS-ST3 TaxID=3025591 RepID=UPI00235B352A|nr:HEXXH motif-containing putative peptide modification protein [Streptomyces sp. TUS-ST3]GLP63551.1 HEXXH motif domain-containing protein [Streptomyces sp. TUS-ST3]
MTREQRHAPFRMPGPLFAEVATGGGSAEALAFLERAERARRLLLLRTLLDRLGPLPTPLTPTAEAWSVLKEAAAAAPDPVDRLLLAPATGGWIAHVLRRLHGTATGPSLWADAGHLCCLAVSASVLAGTEADLRVPLTDGGLCLPGLGLARLPDVGPGVTVGHACTHKRELTLTAEGADGEVTVTVRPFTEPLREDVPEPLATGSQEAWLPLRTLIHLTPSGPVAVPLDDLDPYRDLDDPLPSARLEEAEAVAWQRLFEEAAGILAGRDGGGTKGGGPAPERGAAVRTGPGRVDPALIRAVVPWGRTTALPPAPPTVRVSASSGDAFGAMVIARPSSALALAETLVHEFQHSKLAALLHLFPLLDDDRAERYYAPWRHDPRHLSGLLHGAYAFTGVAGFWRDRLADAPDERAADEAGYHFALRRLQSRLVVRTLRTSGRLTAPGRALLAGLARTLDDWLREPVPPAALARARTAAALHRTEWRLRNVAPVPDGTAHTPDTPPLRSDRAAWADVRTHAFATPSARPRTADEHLAAGDPATALARYADALTPDPTDPHALAGWIVAHAALEPGRTSRRMLARPELLQPSRSG